MFVTLGWDLKPTILVDGEYVLPRAAENIINGKYYRDGFGTWPVDPDTGEKLPMKPISN